MARAGTQRWRNPAPEGDDVQRSIELLDKVLSEYDEHESADAEFGTGGGGGGGGGGGINGSNNGADGDSRSGADRSDDVVVETADAGEDCGSSTEPSIGLTPDDESPSLGTGGHQSEDDGYMSMNGRKAKMALLALRPVPDCPEPLQESAGPGGSSSALPSGTQEFPPPPEEAERIISTLLPMVSPGNSSKRTSVKSSSLRQSGRRDQPGGSAAAVAAAAAAATAAAAAAVGVRSNANATRDSENSVSSPSKHQRAGIHDPATSQTTLPKTRHRRPYGWWERRGESAERNVGASQAGRNSLDKFASLPYDARVVSFDWIPGIAAASARTNTTRSAPIHHHHPLQQQQQQPQPQQQQQQQPQQQLNHRLHHHHYHHHHHQQSEKRREATASRRRRRRSSEDVDPKSRSQHRGSDSPERAAQLDAADREDVDCCVDVDEEMPNEMSKSSSAEECGRMMAARAIDSRGERVNGAESDSSEARFSERRRNSESGRSSIPRSSSVSVERFSMRANYGGGDSSDFSRANSTSNERFNSDFSLAVASASSNDRVSVPSSDPFSLRNLDFVSLSLLGQRADSSERFSDVYSTRNSDFSTRNSTDFRTQSEEEERFSDDSLEELLPAPGPPIAKRHSIAWEVSLEEDPLYAPGSTKVVGRRRRRSSDVSSAGSISKLRDFDDWQDPRQSTTDDDLVSPYSDSSTNDLDRVNPRDLSKNGTYVIRRGRKRERKPLVPKIVSPTETKSLSSFGSRELDRRLTDACGKRYSTTFDDIKSLLREGRLEGLDEPPPDFVPPAPPDHVRIVPLSAVDDDDDEDEEEEEEEEEEDEADADAEADNDEDDVDDVDGVNGRHKVTTKSARHEDPDGEEALPRLPPSPLDEREEEAGDATRNQAEKSSGTTRECNGGPGRPRNAVTTSKSLDISSNLLRDAKEPGMVGATVTAAVYTASRRSSRKSAAERGETKIPVNVLIEDQIVKKALNENRRQLERVSDEIKEIESVKKNVIESYVAEDGSKRTRRTTSDSRGDAALSASKRNSYEGDGAAETRKRHVLERVATAPPLLPSASVTSSSSASVLPAPFGSRERNMQNSLDSETSKTSSSGSESADLDRPPRRSSSNGGPPTSADLLFSSERRIGKHQHQNGQILENRKIDHKQIENVIDAILEDSKNPEFQVSVEVLEFPPLPPSPVEEADEESSDVGNGPISAQPVVATKAKPARQTTRTMDGYRPRVPPHRGGLSVIDGKDHSQSSLDTRSMDAGFSRGRRTTNMGSSSRREVPVERRTLPTDLPGPSRRRAMTTKRQSPSTDGVLDCGTGGSATGSVAPGGSTLGTTVLGVGCPGSGMQTSCSLPETPVFARGSDVPRTPQHAGNPTQPRRQPGWYAPTTATTGYRRNNPGLEQAIIGTELLRLAGGPNRGWYPTRKGGNQPRPASIEHLERLNSAYESRLPGASGDQRKPLTLPTNITPNKYFGQSKHSSASSTREALRRVTSLLIKKGGGSKESTAKSGKDNVSPSGPYPGASEPSDAPKRKGFFKSFWKRSRHYSLENQ